MLSRVITTTRGNLHIFVVFLNLCQNREARKRVNCIRHIAPICTSIKHESLGRQELACPSVQSFLHGHPCDQKTQSHRQTDRQRYVQTELNQDIPRNSPHLALVLAMLEIYLFKEIRLNKGIKKQMHYTVL